MFILNEIGSDGGRSGKFKFDKKVIHTPSFFMTSNFGGGAGDVYRIVTYTDLLENANIPILYNYYYLTVGGTFKVKWTKYISKVDDLNKFMLYIRDKFVDKGYCISKYKTRRKLNWNPIVLLDSGSGNFLRDILKTTNNIGKILEAFNKIIPNLVDFCNKKGVDIMMSMDFAGKYTHKQGEKNDVQYNKFSKNLSEDLKINLKLLEITLDSIKTKEKKFLAYAPVRGSSAKEYSEFTSSILELEKEKGLKFDGFGLGGIANYKEKEDKIWGVPDDSSPRVKAGIIISRAVKAVRNELKKNNDERPIHALGVGSAEQIIPLVNAGADTFDAHSAWRRATDGSVDNAKFVFDETQTGSFSKYLIPLLDNNGDIIKNNKSNVLSYTSLQKLKDDVFCNCYICKKYSIKEIKKLYSQEGEEFKFAKMLIYVHAILQHQIICGRLQKIISNNKKIIDLVHEIPDPKLKNDLETIIKIS